jgi:tRNA U34 5-carboxymethylaminomethyl modifying enzyme MnmG/GidA
MDNLQICGAMVIHVLIGRTWVGKTSMALGKARESTSIGLTKNLQGLRFEINCFKIGTLAQVDIHFVVFNKLEHQLGDDVCGPTFKNFCLS